MGVLSEGRPLPWKEIFDVLEQLKRDALNKLIKIFPQHSHKHRHRDPFTWGDEVCSSLLKRKRRLNSIFQVELTLVRFDRLKKEVQLLDY